ncbi:hypothetical protein DdX_14041 [Ditylenchus destructor]|uniref:Uncharacterized protein n=1 Tax=Ditylenchus destructor TaxID=166010 RepID=A0AAD4QW11_9BILA|nr:hypothetical protein DdX_14041 [Ditylenchus destructor]
MRTALYCKRFTLRFTLERVHKGSQRFTKQHSSSVCAFIVSKRSFIQHLANSVPRSADQRARVQSPQFADQRARVFRPRRDVAPFPERFLPRNEENATPRQNRYAQRSPYQLRSQCARQCLLFVELSLSLVVSSL